MRLDYSAFMRAIQRLGEGLEQLESMPGQELFTDGVIQRFEFVYELCPKMIRRYFDAVAPTKEPVSREKFSDLIRDASDSGLLLHGWDVWSEYRNARNETSHTYDKEKAEQVLRIVPLFLTEAKYLCEQLELRNDVA